MPTIMHCIGTLVEKWIESKMIEGMHAKNKIYLEEDLKGVTSWAHKPKPIKKKQTNCRMYVSS